MVYNSFSDVIESSYSSLTKENDNNIDDNNEVLINNQHNNIQEDKHQINDCVFGSLPRP